MATANHKPSATQAIDDFLRELLRQGALPAKEIFKQGEAKGFTAEQLNRARKRIRARTYKRGLEGWVWELKR